MPCTVWEPRVEQPSTAECACPGFCGMVTLDKSGFAPLCELVLTSTCKDFISLEELKAPFFLAIFSSSLIFL